MFRTLLIVVCVLTTSTGISLADEDGQFSRHLAGCWQHGQIPPFVRESEEVFMTVFMTRLCFEGGVEGQVLHFTCHGSRSFDCWEGAERYALTDNKLHFIYPDTEILCDAQVEPGETLRLYNCDGTKQLSAERAYVRVDNP
jgi:hypothetical protein